MDRVLEAFRLSQDRRGRKAYVSWLDARAENEGGKIEAGTSVKNDWLASPLRMGHPAAMSQLVSHTLKDPKSLKILKKHDKTYKSKD